MTSFNTIHATQDDRSDAMATQQVSLTVFGATGFTARFVLQTIVDQIGDIVSSGDDPNFTWSIAGRNADSLNKIRDSLKDKISNERWLPTVVVADVKDPSSLKRMAAQTRCECGRISG